MRTFAIAGAPKAATTALAESLAPHPEIAFSIPKEPYWYGTDLEPLRRVNALRSRDDYLACFHRRPKPRARWQGEASTLYLSSPDAIAQLDRDEPDALVICVVRNPIDVAHAFHMQMVYAGFEPQADFETAWRASGARRSHPSLACPVPRLLDYRDVASLGRQVERARDQVGADRVHVIVYDDIVADLPSVLATLGERLGLSRPLRDPGRVNGAMVMRSPRLARALRSTTGRRIARAAKSTLPPRVSRSLIASKDRVLKQTQGREALSPALREELVEVFTPEVTRLEAVLGRDLEAWLQHPADCTR
jgi:hypothetical protein